MINAPTIAYLITFSTYGTWLHGDERGSVNRKATSGIGKYVEPDPVLNEHLRENLKHPVVHLNGEARGIVHEAIEDYCRFKNWPMLALNVRTNHVHIVVSAVESASKMLNAIKARATRLLREDGAFDKGLPIWTERGNKAKLETNQAVEDAIYYVKYGQGPDI